MTSYLRKHHHRNTVRSAADNDLTIDLRRAFQYLMSLNVGDRRVMLDFMEASASSEGTKPKQNSNVIHFPPPAKP